jgi:leader peptidase (prepilin peptidase)/N-methyltransferase
MWVVLATLGVLLAAIDARTSWLPLRLTQIAWLAMAIAALMSALLGGSVWVAARALAGAAIAGALYVLVWLISRGGFGFGDVRFAPLLGAAAAAGSWAYCG